MNSLDEPMFNPTKYKISTITATGSLNTSVDLDAFFAHIPVVKEEEGGNGITYAEFGVRKNEIVHKGVPKKRVGTRKPHTNKKENNKKRFDNQVTIIYKFQDGLNATINAKIFRNGNVQMTGLRYGEQGHIVLNYVISILTDIYATDDSIVADFENMKDSNYKICLINCDFRVGFEINRDKLYSQMMNHYKVTASYEPCIYPGVKIQYWWNDQQTLKDGCCYCSKFCGGKGCGSGEGECKKITIAVFQSGCIIITGGQSTEQIDEAYEFICGCIKDNMPNILKIPIPLPNVEVSKKKIYIKKSKIRPAVKA